MQIHIHLRGLAYNESEVQGPNGPVKVRTLVCGDAASPNSVHIAIPEAEWPKFVQFVTDPVAAAEAHQARSKLILPGQNGPAGAPPRRPGG